MRVLQAGCRIAAWIMVMGLAAQANGQYDGAEPPPAEFLQGFDSIQEKQAKAWVNTFAAKFAGRGTGQTGYIKAAHFVAGKLAEWGWEPAGENGTYFQLTPLVRVAADPERSVLRGPEGLEIRAPEIAFNMGDQPSLEAKITVLNVRGQAVTVPEEISVTDQVVVLIQNDVRVDLLRELGRKRPAAILRVVDREPQVAGRVSPPGRGGGPTRRGGAGDAEITVAAARRLVQACGGAADLVDPRKEDGVTSQTLASQVTIEVRNSEQEVVAPNVVAWYPGSDPLLRDEFVGMGAHLDHLGWSRGSLYPGANDNASGSTAILQIARAISLNKVKPKRSVLFIAFAAEELGLLGSKYYCDHPTRDLGKMQCFLNMDMVGRNEEQQSETAEENEGSIHLVGSQVIPSTLHEITMEANRYVNFRFEYDEEERVARRSDQESFIKKGVPVTFLFGGFTPRYHRPTDVPDVINHAKIVSAARLNYLTLMFAADRGVTKQEATKAE